tara:strand:- start:3840 stop:5954 length:2115 start_codon:yes stop_codon:yes gene_type:complete
MSKQSVILNFNPKFASNQASNFLQPVAQEFDIPVESEVCLYGGSLSRAPIVLSEDSDLTLNINGFIGSDTLTLDKSSIVDNYPIFTNYLSQEMGDFGLDDDQANNLLKVTIPKSSYSRDTLCNVIATQINDALRNVVGNIDLRKPDPAGPPELFQIGANYVDQVFPYYWDFDRNNFFTGLRSDNRTWSVNMSEVVGTLVNGQQFSESNSNESLGNSANVTTTTSGQFIESIKALGAKSEDWTKWARLSSPIYGVNMNDNTDNIVANYGGVNSQFDFSVMADRTGNNTQKRQLLVGFTNTLAQSEWAVTGMPDLGLLLPENNLVPKVLLGANIVQHFGPVSSTTPVESTYIDIIMASAINDLTVDYLDGDTTKDLWGKDDAVGTMNRIIRLDGLQTADVGDNAVQNNRYSFNFYSVPYLGAATRYINGVAQANSEPERRYYFQFYGHPDGHERVKMFDSKDLNVYIDARIIEDGAFTECVKSKRTANDLVSCGLIPYVFMYDIGTPTEGDLVGVYNPSGNYIVEENEAGDKFDYKVMLTNYEIKASTTDLRNVLGVSEVSTDYQINGEVGSKTIVQNNVYVANAYPLSRSMGGLIDLYSDNIRYNIELNLPITSFNTTENENNLPGQKRNILYNQEPFIDGISTNIKNQIVTKEIKPNTLKYLTLNNINKINLNNLVVQIRRAKTNEIANEITDATIEILIESKN